MKSLLIMARAAATLILAMEASSARAATVTWDGGAGTNLWHDADNWNPNGLPTAADDVVIDVPGDVTVVHSVGTSSIRTLTCSETLTVSGGTISPSQPSSISGVLNLQANGVQGINGAGDVVVLGTLNWSGGRMAGTGKTVISRSGTMTISGLPLIKSLARTLENHGSATLSNSSTITFSNSEFLNAGLMIVDISTQVAVNGVMGTTTAFTNTGTLEKRGIGTLVFASVGPPVPFHNNGELDVQEGVLWMNSAGSHSGTTSISGGVAATLIQSGVQDFDETAQINGSGKWVLRNATATVECEVSLAGPFVLESGTVGFSGSTALGDGTTFAQWTGASFAGPVTLSSGQITVSGAVNLGSANVTFDELNMIPTGGQLSGSGEILVEGHFGWNGSLYGPGRVTVARTATMIRTGWGALRCELVNDGVATWSNSETHFANGRFVNNGTTYIANTNSFFSKVIGQFGSNEYINNGNLIRNNDGSFQFESGPAQVAFHNNGFVQVDQGSLSVSGGMHTGAFVVSQVPQGTIANLTFGAGNTLLTKTASINCERGLTIDCRPGLFQSEAPIHVGENARMILQSGSMTSNGELSVDGTLEMTIYDDKSAVSILGPVEFGESASILIYSNSDYPVQFGVDEMTVPRFELTLGTVAGPAILNVTEHFVGSDIMQGSGIINLEANSSSALGDLLFERTINNYGTMTVRNDLQFRNATLNNYGEIQTDADESRPFRFQGNGGSGVVFNAGVLSKYGIAVLEFSTFGGGVSLINDGIVNVVQGDVEIWNGCSGSGSVHVAIGTTLKPFSDCEFGHVQVDGELVFDSQFPPVEMSGLRIGSTGRLSSVDATPSSPWMNVSGDILLDGVLELLGYWTPDVPIPNSLMPFIRGGTVNGTFASIYPSALDHLTICPEYYPEQVGLRVRMDGDINGDLLVNIDDLLLVINWWGSCPPAPEVCLGNADCYPQVNADDLLLVINNWD